MLLPVPQVKELLLLFINEGEEGEGGGEEERGGDGHTGGRIMRRPSSHGGIAHRASASSSSAPAGMQGFMGDAEMRRRQAGMQAAAVVLDGYLEVGLAHSG